MKVLVTQQMRLFEEALITLIAVEAAVLNVVSLLVIEKVDLLKELLLADFTAEFRLFRVHFTVREKATGGLQHLSAYITFLLGGLRQFRLYEVRMTRLVLEKRFDVLELHVTLSTELQAMHGRFVIHQVALVAVRVRAIDQVALISAHNVSLEMITQQNELLRVVFAHDAGEHDRQLFVRLLVVHLERVAIVEDRLLGTVDTQDLYRIFTLIIIS